MMPSDGLEIHHNIQKFSLHLGFCNGVFFPVFWVVLIFEHIDTCMGNTRVFCMEFFYSLEYLSVSRIGKSKDKINIYWYWSDIYGWLYSFQCCEDGILTRTMDLLQTCIIQCLYSHREAIDSEIDESDYIFLIDVFWVGFEGDLGFSIFIKREAF